MANNPCCKCRNGGECECFTKNKPPIGLRPRKINDQHRKVEILAAMKRYSLSGVTTPPEWIEELRVLIEVT